MGWADHSKPHSLDRKDEGDSDRPKEQMRILYGTTSYPPAIGGTQVHLHRLARCMKDAGHEVRVVTHWSTFRTDWLLGTTVFSGPRKEYEHEGIKVSQIGLSPSKGLSSRRNEP